MCQDCSQWKDKDHRSRQENCVMCMYTNVCSLKYCKFICRLVNLLLCTDFLIHRYLCSSLISIYRDEQSYENPMNPSEFLPEVITHNVQIVEKGVLKITFFVHLPNYILRDHIMTKVTMPNAEGNKLL